MWNVSQHAEFLPKLKPHSGCTGIRDHSKASDLVLPLFLALEMYQAESEFVSSVKHHFFKEIMSFWVDYDRRSVHKNGRIAAILSKGGHET